MKGWPVVWRWIICWIFYSTSSIEGFRSIGASKSLRPLIMMQSLKSTSSPFSFRFLESNSWEIRSKSIHFLLDPVLDTLDFGIPWLYAGKKKYLNGIKELSTFVQQHQQSPATSTNRIDFVLISQGLDDHAHRPTLRRLQQSLPELRYIIPPSAEKILIECGIEKKQLIILSPGQSYEYEKQDERLKIIATSGALVGPPWQAKENGYIVQSSVSSNLSSFYYEPHGMFDPEELQPYEGKIPIVISPIVSQEITLSNAIPPYTLVAGNQQIIDLLAVLKPKFLIPMLNGDLNQEGLLSSVLQSKGSEEEFKKLLEQSANKYSIKTQIIPNLFPGKEISL